VTDWTSKALSEVHKIGTAEAAPVAEPVTADTVETTPEPVVEAAPATEITSEAAPSVEAPAGNPPPDQPPPASDVPTDSAIATLEKRGLKFPDEKTAAEYLRVESELAARVRAEKAAAKAQTAPAAAQPATAAAPVAPPAAPAPPVRTAVAAPADVEAQVQAFVNRDPECSGLSEQFNALVKDVQTYIVRDRSGRVVGGKLADIDAEIAQLQGHLQVSADSLKKYGIEAPGLDAMARADLERVLQGKRLDRADIMNTINGRMRDIEAVKARYTDRVGEGRQYFQRELNVKAEAEAFEARVTQHATAFEKQWTGLVPAALKTHNVPDDMQEDIHKALYTAALARPDVIPADEMPGFIDGVIKHELAKSDKYHRSKSAEYARIKEGDTARTKPAPTGKAAVANPAPTENGSWEDRARMKARALRQGART
jgi:hypothetical protein